MVLERGVQAYTPAETPVRKWCWALIACGAVFAAPASAQAPLPAGTFTMEQVLAYPFVPELEAAEKGDAVAFVRVVKGVRNVWVAKGPAFKPRQLTHYAADDGQEITQLTFSPEGAHLVYVRGGDHDANWEAKLPPDPASSPVEPKVTIWAAQASGARACQGRRGRWPGHLLAGRTCLHQGQSGVDGAVQRQREAPAPVLRPGRRRRADLVARRREARVRLQP